MSWIKFTAHYTEKRSPISREKQTQKTKIKYIKRQAVKNEFLLIKDRKLNFFFIHSVDSTDFPVKFMKIWIVIRLCWVVNLYDFFQF